jgi:hypothetical protein
MIRKTIDLWEHQPGFYTIPLSLDGVPTFRIIPHQPANLVLTGKIRDAEQHKAELMQTFVTSMQKVLESKKQSSSFKENLTTYFSNNTEVPKQIKQLLSSLIKGKLKDYEQYYYPNIEIN